jgi:hypothetical protein
MSETTAMSNEQRCRGLVAQELKLLRRLKPCIAQNLQNLLDLNHV